MKIPVGKQCGFVQFVQRYNSLSLVSENVTGVTNVIAITNVIFFLYVLVETMPKKHCSG